MPHIPNKTIASPQKLKKRLLKFLIYIIKKVLLNLVNSALLICGKDLVKKLSPYFPIPITLLSPSKRPLATARAIANAAFSRF